MASEAIPQSADAALARARELYRAGTFAAGVAFTTAAIAAHPRSADLWNVHGAMLRMTGEPQAALAAFGEALRLDPAHGAARANRGGAFLDLAKARNEAEGPAAAEAVLDEALGLDPENLALLEAKAAVLRAAGARDRAEAFLAALVARRPEIGWAQLQLGDVLSERGDAAAEAHLRRARALEPASLDALVGLVQHLARTKGPEAGNALDEAHRLARAALGLGALTPQQAKVLRDVFAQVCDFEAAERLGDFRTLGRAWAQAGLHTALFRQLSRVRTDADRRELLEEHRICGRAMVARAERRPIRRPAPRPPGEKIRLGFLSSDLRRHPVGYFAEPVFQHLDPSRFELFCYAFDPGPADAMQSAFAARSTFRRMPDATAREAAQVIADDDLDLLIELGGSTHMNKLEVLAWRPAPRQASWLGYPHSEGLPTIDGLICDPFVAPADATLLAEAAWRMPRSWIALGSTFSDAFVIDPTPPEVCKGCLTFGTANNPYKYTPEVLATWASIVAATPGSRFAIVRPEAASAVFREHIIRAFAAGGVSADWIDFHPVRHEHMPIYNEIDISLDTFPLTGGTTTVEALWMGVPVVSLRGPALYERLSASILSNAGLAEMIADDLGGYRAIALRLAADGQGRAALRSGLRERIRRSPLGDTAAFARDFYALVETVVRGG